MARPTKQGLDYFPFDVGFFGDNGIRILKARYRSDGIAVYVKLLCDIYKEGYFLPVKHFDDYIFVIANELGISENAVEQIITFLHNRAMVRLYRKDELTDYEWDAVITSHGIQKRYATAMKSRRKKGVDDIKRGFWLLTQEEENEINAYYKSGINEGLSENNPHKSENNPDLSEKNPTKESKKKLLCTDVPRDKADFFQRFPLLKESAAGVDDSGIDYAKLTACFLKSKKHLQKWRTFKWIVDHYSEILSGKFDDYAEAQAEKPAPALPADVQAANARAAREKFYADRRNAVEAKAQKTLQFAKVQSVEFEAATRELAKLPCQMAKAELCSPEDLKELQEKESALHKARAYALAKIGLTEADLLPKWYCGKCSDTGYLPDGTLCDCFKP